MVNKAQLVGRAGSNVEVHTFENGNKVAKFSLATSETFKDKSGEKKTNTEWHNIVIFGKLADVAEKYIKKGDLLYLDGKITYRKYEKDGKTSYFTEINVHNMRMLGSKSESKQSNANNDPQKEIENTENGDLPF